MKETTEKTQHDSRTASTPAFRMAFRRAIAMTVVAALSTPVAFAGGGPTFGMQQNMADIEAFVTGPFMISVLVLFAIAGFGYSLIQMFRGGNWAVGLIPIPIGLAIFNARDIIEAFTTAGASL